MEKLGSEWPSSLTLLQIDDVPKRGTKESCAPSKLIFSLCHFLVCFFVLHFPKGFIEPSIICNLFLVVWIYFPFNQHFSFFDLKEETKDPVLLNPSAALLCFSKHRHTNWLALLNTVCRWPNSVIQGNSPTVESVCVCILRTRLPDLTWVQVGNFMTGCGLGII